MTLKQIREYFEAGDYAKVIEKNYQNTPEAKLILCLAKVLEGMGSDDLVNEVKELLEIEPDNNYWQSTRGLGFLLLGDIKRAYETLKNLCDDGKGRAIDYGRLGAVYLTMQDLDLARQMYQEAVHRQPGRAEWHNNLAGILVRQQKYEEALEHYNIALSINPDLKQAVEAKQKLLMAMDKTDEMVKEQEEIFRKDPENPENRWRLARAYYLDNRLEDAIRLLNQHILKFGDILKLKEAKETDSKADEKFKAQCTTLEILAEISQSSGRYVIAKKALLWLKRLVENEKKLQVLIELALISIELEDFEEAEKYIQEAESEFKETHKYGLDVAKAQLLSAKGDFKEAERILKQVLKVYPGDARVLTQLGQVFLWIGKLDQAGECFEQASKINPVALSSMVNAKKIPESESALKIMKQIADNPLLAKETRISMSFALAEVYEKKKEYDLSFHYLKQANDLTDKGLNYDPEDFSRQVSNIISVYSSEYFDKLEKIRKSDRTPIFVVGMPRSGTTLTEQILASHPEIFGAGELSLIAKLTQLMPRVLKTKKPYPFCVEYFTPYYREQAALYYLNGLMAYDKKHQYVVDKMPHNFLHLGLIASILPKAKIIHIERDPRDTALSNYQQNFKAKYGGMGFAFNLEKIGKQINDYYRIMEHWRKTLPIPMLEITYEELVADQERVTRRLLDFIGVEWNDSVLDFYKTERPVRTASVAQVRQPVYKTSRKKWKKYEPYLKPLIETLDPKIIEKWDKKAKNYE